MKAIIRETEFMGKAGVGVYINHGLSSFVIHATDLLATIVALKDMGYEIVIKDSLIDETEQEDKDVMDEIEDWSLAHDWDDEDELVEQMEAFLAADLEALC